MKLTLSKMIKHFSLVTRHRHRVLINCIKCGIPFRGMVHDLSKYLPSEFFESARYYQGNRSPIGAARRHKGYCLAWLHHKGVNKHHLEYWSDFDCNEHPLVPYKYIVECVCDKLAATRIYAGKDYTTDMPLKHWRTYGCKVFANERSLAFIERVFTDILLFGEKKVLNSKYMKSIYSEICLQNNDSQASLQK